MNLLKKLGVLMLSSTMLVVSVFGLSSSNSYAATSCIKKLSLNTTYKYDIDGDGDKDTIKTYVSKGKLLLKINKCVKTLSPQYNSYLKSSYAVKLYDFNKKDKSLDIVYSYIPDDVAETRILKFKNNTCEVNKFYYDSEVYSYNPSNGMVTFREYFEGRYKDFTKVLGSFTCYSKVKVNGYKLSNQYTANTTNTVKQNKYIASKNLTAYTSVSGTKKAFTVKKNSYVNIYALYQNGNKKYIKVKNSAGKYGYIKIGTNKIFKDSSLLYFR